MFERLKPLYPYLRRYWKSLAWGGVAVILYNVLKVLIPLVIGHAIDDMNHGVTQHKIVFHALRILLIAAVSAVFLYITRQVIIGASREIEFDLRNDIFANLERQAPSYYHTHRTGDIMARTTNDLAAVRQLLGPAIMYSANTIVFMTAALPFMYRISPKLTFFAFVPLPMASVLVQYFGARIHTRFERIQAMFSDISAKAQENFSGARLIRAFAQEEAEIESFELANQEYIGRSLHLVRLMAMLWPTLELVLGLSLMLTLLVGGHEVIMHRISAGQFTAFFVYMVQLTWPMIAVGWVVNLFQRGTASVVRIDELLKQKPAIADDPSLIAPPLSKASSSTPTNPSSRPEAAPFAAAVEGPPHFSKSATKNITTPQHPPSEPWTLTPVPSLRGEITFRNLTFAYPNGPDVLRNIDLHIPAGSSLAIVGPTGSGKSTLVNLIPRMLDATPGSVLIDGTPIRCCPLADLRAAIGFVPQETFLFSDTIRHNIALGTPNATDPQIEDAAEIAHIRSEILEFPRGFDTMVGERGVTLSGGQKQRTAIARAVVRNPAILILDDALASVDTYTEEQILSGLRSVMQGRTTIFISHRISTCRSADHIAVLVNGRIAEYGTHEDLLAREGYYTSLFEKQRLEEELAVTT
jgi:ATP-binding cassette, subfamily B, multidrug efflux pump